MVVKLFSNDQTKHQSDAHLFSLDSQEGKKCHHKQLHLSQKAFSFSSKLSLDIHVFLLMRHSFSKLLQQREFKVHRINVELMLVTLQGGVVSCQEGEGV